MLCASGMALGGGSFPVYMSVKALTWAFHQTVGDPTSKLILIAIADHCDHNNECWPSRGLLATYAECSVDTIDRRIKEMIEKGLIEKEPQTRANGSDTSNRYRLRMGAADCGSPQPQSSAPPPAAGVRLPQPQSSAAPRTVKRTTKRTNVVATDDFGDVDGNPTPLDGIPLELNCHEFRVAWSEWQLYRKQRRKPLTDEAIKRQFAKLVKIGPRRAIDAINHSIFSSYEGIYEPKSHEIKSTKTGPRVIADCAANAGTYNAGKARNYR